MTSTLTRAVSLFYFIPIVLVQITAAAAGNDHGLFLVGIAFVLSLCSVPLSVAGGRMLACARIERELAAHPRWRFVPITLERLLDNRSIELLTNRIIDERNAKLFRLEAPSGDAVPPDPIALAMFGGPSYLFVRNYFEGARPPSGFGRFLVLHELGHATRAAAWARDRHVFGIGTALLCVIWIAMLVERSPRAVIALILLLMVLLALRTAFDLRPGAGWAHSEINADRFAFNALSREDRAKTMRFLAKHPPVDGSLYDFENEMRVQHYSWAESAIVRDGYLPLDEPGTCPVRLVWMNATLLVALGLVPQRTVEPRLLLALTAVTAFAAFAGFRLAVARERQVRRAIRERTDVSDRSLDSRLKDAEDLAAQCRALIPANNQQPPSEMLGAAFEWFEPAQADAAPVAGSLKLRSAMVAVARDAVAAVAMSRGKETHAAMRTCRSAVALLSEQPDDVAHAALLHALSICHVALRRRHRGELCHRQSQALLRQDAPGPVLDALAAQFRHVRYTAFVENWRW